MKVVAINGSPHKNGNVSFMLNYIGEKLNRLGVEFKVISAMEAVLSAKTPFCTACSSPCSRVCFEGTKLEKAYEDLVKADFVILASPVYFGTVSAQLKAFFDKTRWIRGNKLLINKPGAAVSVGASKYGGQETTIRAIHDIMLVQGMSIIGDGSFEGGAGHNGVAASLPIKDDHNAFERANALVERILSMNNEQGTANN